MPNASTDWKSICSVERFARNWAPGHPSRNPIPHTETCSFFLSFFLLLALCRKGERLFIFFFLCLFFFFPSLLSSFACLESNSHAVLTRNAHRGRLGISSFFFPHVTRDKMCDTLYKHGASITSREPLKTTRTFNLTIAVHLFGTVQTRER